MRFYKIIATIILFLGLYFGYVLTAGSESPFIIMSCFMGVFIAGVIDCILYLIWYEIEE